MSDGPDYVYNLDTVVCPRHERRAAVRYRLPVGKLDHAALAHSFRSLEGLVLDVSATGVGLMLPAPVGIGTKVFLQLKAKGSEAADGPELVAKVRCAAAHKESGWLIWCVLKNPLTEEQVQALR